MESASRHHCTLVSSSSLRLVIHFLISLSLSLSGLRKLFRSRCTQIKKHFILGSPAGRAILCSAAFKGPGTRFCGVGFYTLKALTRENIVRMPLVWWHFFANVKGRLYCSKVWGFLMFLKVPSAHQGCIYLIKHTVKTVQMWNIIAN